MAKELTGPERLLLQQITQALRSKSQYDQWFAEFDAEGINRLHALGRRAARDLGWKVRTFATVPDRSEDRGVRVIIVVTESSPLHEDLQRIRGAKAIRRAFVDWKIDPSHRNG